MPDALGSVRSGVEADAPGSADAPSPTSYTGRLFAVIDAMLRAGAPLGPRPLSRIANVDRNSTWRMLQNLTEIGLVESVDGSYRLAPAFFDLCRAGVALDGSGNMVAPFVERLMREFGESAGAFRRSGDVFVLVHMMETDKTIRYVADYGTIYPLYAGAPGRAILSTMKESELEDYLRRTKLQVLTPETVVEPDELRRRIAAARRAGYARSESEAVDGGWAYAAPYFDAQGTCVGALSILGPLSRPPADAKELASRLLETAAELSSRLGLTLS